MRTQIHLFEDIMANSANFDAQKTQVTTGKGFIAALDQSGGSTPKALGLYGVTEDMYDGEQAMFDEIHAMRSRIILDDNFSGEKVLGAILFERTMRGLVEDTPVAEYLWNTLSVVPFLKIDKGLEDRADDAQVLKPMPGLTEMLQDAKGFGVFGTKARSVIHGANEAGIKAVVAQQFAVGKQVVDAGMVPIIEPEVDIHSDSKAEAETLLKAAILDELNALDDGQDVMLKLTIPTEDGLYVELAQHPRVLRVVALSGGYSTAEACEKLGKQPDMIASFSRALAEGLTKQMSDEEFSTALGNNIDKIFAASC